MTDTPEGTDAVGAGAETMSRTEHDAAMRDLITQSISDPQLESRNPARYRLHQGKIHGHAKAIAEIDDAAQEAADGVRLERMRRGLPGVAPYGEQRDQDQRVIEAKAEMAKLAELNFETYEVDPDILPWELDFLKMQRMLAEKDWRSLTPLMEKELAAVATPESRQMFRQFAEAAMDPDLKASLARLLLAWCHAAHEPEATE